MKVVVADLEANSPVEPNEAESRALGNIIQVAAVQLDCRTGKIDNEFNQYVNPALEHPGEQLAPRIVELTAITQEMIDQQGRHLRDVLTDFVDYLGGKALAVWGRDDRVIEDECARLGVEHRPFNVLNLKVMAMGFRCIYPSSKGGRGLKGTMDAFGIPFVGRQHCGLVDSRNTARWYWAQIAARAAAERTFETLTEIRR